MAHDLGARVFLLTARHFCVFCYRHIFLLAGIRRFADHHPPKVQHDSVSPSSDLRLTGY
ncbi:hypothetical protein AGR1C_pAt20254 [Agrobacterium fabacearum TT111]|nr:hypothetical protein AGR1C_pAt20254 [Agrobacterium fabacearum TT111]